MPLSPNVHYRTSRYDMAALLDLTVNNVPCLGTVRNSQRKRIRFSTYSHILRYWGLGLQYMNCGGGTQFCTWIK